ncbi:MAG: DNA-binding response regulator, partial [Arthrobacter sp.]
MIAWADAGLTAADGAPAVIRVFILDDHELVRRGLQELLEGEGFLVVGSSGSAVEATRRIQAL